MNPFSTQPIKPRRGKPADLEAAAAQALGGEAVRPPSFPMQPIARAEAKEDPQASEARAAFSQAVTAGNAASPVFGNTTFDGIPAAQLERRSKVGTARRMLADLASRVVSDAKFLNTLLDDLADDAETLRAAEAFDVDYARTFINHLKDVVASITLTETTAAAEASPATEQTTSPEP